VSEPGGIQWLECPCCGRAEVIEGQVGCEHCQGADLLDVCPVVNEPDVPCEPMYLFCDDQEAMCPYCGCEVGVSVGDDTVYATHDYMRHCPPRVRPW